MGRKIIQKVKLTKILQKLLVVKTIAKCTYTGDLICKWEETKEPTWAPSLPLGRGLDPEPWSSCLTMLLGLWVGRAAFLYGHIGRSGADDRSPAWDGHGAGGTVRAGVV